MNNTEHQELRCYHFNNFYLAGIHAGIQAAHAQHELAHKYLGIDTDASELYEEWAHHHKTIIVLNAGMAKDLNELVELFKDPENYYPWSEWRESEEALNGCITSIAMVLPDNIYKWSRLVAKAWDRKPYEGSLYKTDNPAYFLLKEAEGSAKILGAHSGHIFNSFNKFEVELMRRMFQMNLFS